MPSNRTQIAEMHERLRMRGTDVVETIRVPVSDDLFCDFAKRKIQARIDGYQQETDNWLTHFQGYDGDDLSQLTIFKRHLDHLRVAIVELNWVLLALTEHEGDDTWQEILADQELPVTKKAPQATS